MLAFKDIEWGMKDLMSDAEILDIIELKMRRLPKDRYDRKRGLRKCSSFTTMRVLIKCSNSLRFCK